MCVLINQIKAYNASFKEDGTVLVADATPEGPAKLAVEDAIQAVVAHFERNGIKLQPDGRGEWVVADPKGDGYEVVVSLRTFPAGATEKEMQDALKGINLAYILNAPARVAMSHPGLRATDPAKKLPKLDEVPVAAKLESLFKEYPPPEPKK